MTVIPPAELVDLYIERLAIEAQAVRIICESSDAILAERIVAIEAAAEALRQASARGEAWEIGDADLSFHQILVDAARSPRLSRAMMTLAYETRIASLSASDGYSVRRSVSPTYLTLIEALRSREIDSAVAALAQQFDDAVRRLSGDDDSVDTIETETENEPQQFEPLATDALEI